MGPAGMGAIPTPPLTDPYANTPFGIRNFNPTNAGLQATDTSQWENAADSMGKVNIGSMGDTTRPPWWDAQVGGHKYGSFHKFGPNDYADTFNLQPGNTYSYNDIITNQMLGDMDQIDWSRETSPYRRSTPLIKSHWSGIGSEVPDELLYEPIYDDEGNIEGYSYNPYKDENNALMGEWLPEDYRINPYLGMGDEVFEFRDFPWMNEGNAVLTETFNNDLDTANLDDNDLYHLMRNGYTLEEAQEILNEQIGDGSFEMAEALTPDASFKILQGLADKSPEYFYNTLPMIYGDDLWDETPMFNYGGDFYGNSELSWG